MKPLDRAVEALLFASDRPLGLAEMAQRAGEGRAAIEAALRRLGERHAGSGITLVQRGDHWLFQTAPDLAPLLRTERESPRRLSRAAIEALAIIAYHQPASRAEIEAIRGVAIAKGTLDVLMEAGWVMPAGRRRTPGRPLVYATTPAFLVHFGLASLADLPGVDDLRAAGLLDPLDPGQTRFLFDNAEVAADVEPTDAEFTAPDVDQV